MLHLTLDKVQQILIGRPSIIHSTSDLPITIIAPWVTKPALKKSPKPLYSFVCKRLALIDLWFCNHWQVCIWLKSIISSHWYMIYYSVIKGQLLFSQVILCDSIRGKPENYFWRRNQTHHWEQWVSAFRCYHTVNIK